MPTTNQSRIELTSDGTKVVNELNRVERAGRTFASSFGSIFSNVNRYVDAATQHIGVFGSAITALGSGMILKKIFGIGEYMPVNDALLRMQAYLHLSAREADQLKDKLASLAIETGKSQQEIFSSAKELSRLYKGDDLLKITAAGAKLSEATEAPLETSVALVSQIQKMYHVSAGDAENIKNAMVATRAPIENMGIMFQRGIARGGGAKGYQDVLALVGALQRLGVSNPRLVGQVEQVFTGVENKAAFLKRGGVDIQGKSYLGIIEAFDSWIKKAKGKGRTDEGIAAMMNKQLGEGAGEWIPFLIKGEEELKKSMEDQGKAAQIAGEIGAASAQTWSHQLGQVKASLAGIRTDLSFIYDIVKKPLGFLAGSPGLTKGLGYGAAGLSLAVGGGLVWGQLRNMFKGLGGTAAGVAEGKALQSIAGIQPVYVTNFSEAPGGAGSAVGKAGMLAAAGGAFGAALSGSIIAAFMAAVTYITNKGNPAEWAAKGDPSGYYASARNRIFGAPSWNASYSATQPVNIVINDYGDGGISGHSSDPNHRVHAIKRGINNGLH